MKKRIKVFAILLMMIFLSSSLLACKSDKSTKVSNESLDTEEKDISKQEEVIETEKSDLKDLMPTQASEEKPKNKEGESIIMQMRDISSKELVKEIIIGWNLGNTLDATDGKGIQSETSWGNPKTTKEMIDAVKTEGFNTIRIPTTWEKHLGPAPDYIIDDAWLDRVQEIVDYARANEMFIILNLHHEEWHYPSYENEENAINILTKVWKQIADRFEAYDEHLIFEGLNEPRLKGTEYEWNGGNEEGWEVVNKMNTAFVQTIRNAGGNNPLRHLMIPPYAASSNMIAWPKFVIPEDDKIIVSIHAYTPYNFALNITGTTTWSVSNASDTREIDNLMNSINQNFLMKGVPVIIGEFGAMEKNNTESRKAWAEYYIKKAKEKGIPCIWWDNGAFAGNGELFGLFDRRSVTWKTPEVVEALMNGLE